MEISPVNHSTTVNYEAIDKIFSNYKIADRKIVAISIAGAARVGKSFFVDYCLRFMYANVRNLLIAEMFL